MTHVVAWAAHARDRTCIIWAGMRASHVCIVTACLASGVVAGCGSAAHPTAGLSSQNAGTLRSQLATVASDAARGDRAGALAALSAADADVSRDARQLTSAERSALSTGIAHLRSRIAATVPAPAATTTTATTSATTTATQPAASGPPGKAPKGEGPNGQAPPGHPHGHGHGGDQGNGNGGDGGGD